jgi:hypothetical protein
MLVYMAYHLLIKEGYIRAIHLTLFYVFAMIVIGLRITSFGVQLKYWANKNDIGNRPNCFFSIGDCTPFPIGLHLTLQDLCIYFKMMLGLTQLNKFYNIALES